MKHTQADKYTIAWFKIAECVSRGEKERALGVYRLLSHSFNDDAVARQLEADIYLSCNEQDRAIELYRQSIDLYVKSQRFLEAAAVGQHLMMLLPHDENVRAHVIACYVLLRNPRRIYHYFQSLISDYGSGHYSKDLIVQLEKTIDVFFEKNYENDLQEFLVMIKTLDEALYNHACSYIKK